MFLQLMRLNKTIVHICNDFYKLHIHVGKICDSVIANTKEITSILKQQNSYEYEATQTQDAIGQILYMYKEDDEEYDC